ncbi:MAG: hypothetical protein CL557_12395 [Alphaproteobacteria bacterium]|nr:hypothetical protein [Alphaproteobacteria bacterium]
MVILVVLCQRMFGKIWVQHIKEIFFTLPSTKMMGLYQMAKRLVMFLFLEIHYQREKKLVMSRLPLKAGKKKIMIGMQN